MFDLCPVGHIRSGQGHGDPEMTPGVILRTCSVWPFFRLPHVRSLSGSGGIVDISITEADPQTRCRSNPNGLQQLPNCCRLHFVVSMGADPDDRAARAGGAQGTSPIFLPMVGFL